AHEPGRNRTGARTRTRGRPSRLRAPLSRRRATPIRDAWRRERRLDDEEGRVRAREAAGRDPPRSMGAVDEPARAGPASDRRTDVLALRNGVVRGSPGRGADRKSTRLNSSHANISY